MVKIAERKHVVGLESSARSFRPRVQPEPVKKLGTTDEIGELIDSIRGIESKPEPEEVR